MSYREETTLIKMFPTIHNSTPLFLNAEERSSLLILSNIYDSTFFAKIANNFLLRAAS